IPQLYGMSYKELLHNITDKVWTYCYESRYVPECQEQLISWYRGNPDIAGIGVRTLAYNAVWTQLIMSADVDSLLRPSRHFCCSLQGAAFSLLGQMVEMASKSGKKP